MHTFVCYEYRPPYPNRGKRCEAYRLAPGDRLSAVVDSLPASTVRWSQITCGSQREALERFGRPEGKPC